MGNRYLQCDDGSFYKGLVHIYLTINIGATGAPTINSEAQNAVTSVVRNSAGDYTVTLQDAWRVLMKDSISMEAASPQDLTFQATDVDLPNKTYQFVCHTATTPTDPADGSVLRLLLTVRSSGVV